MPYASIRILQGLTAGQKKRLAEDVGVAVATGLGHPSQEGMVAYELVDIPAENYARGGKIYTDGQPSAYVIVNVLQGRTAEQKIKIAEYVTTAIAGHLGIPGDSERIVVEIVDISAENISHGGKLTLDAPPPVII